jgi:transposase
VLTLPASVRIYLAVEPIDLRRGHDGLSAVVLGRRRDRCKILFWDRGGLVLYYKRLEKGRFRMPRVTADGRAVEMDATELAMLLDGIDVRYVRRAEHWQPKKAGDRAQGIDKTIAV